MRNHGGGGRMAGGWCPLPAASRGQPLLRATDWRMRRARRVLGYVAASLVALVLLAYGVVYVVSEIKVRRTFAIVPYPIAVPSDSESVAHGARLARLRGCVGCHGARAQGDTFVDQWMLARVISPDLTRSVRAY